VHGHHSPSFASITSTGFTRKAKKRESKRKNTVSNDLKHPHPSILFQASKFDQPHSKERKKDFHWAYGTASVGRELRGRKAILPQFIITTHLLVNSD
jgi:hypothetical protein